MICPKLCGNCAFLQNFRTRKLGEITVFYAMKLEQRLYSSRTLSPFLLHKRNKISFWTPWHQNWYQILLLCIYAISTLSWNLLIINNRPKWRHLLFRKQIGDVLKFAPVRLLALSLILTSCFGHKNLVYKHTWTNEILWKNQTWVKKLEKTWVSVHCNSWKFSLFIFYIFKLTWNFLAKFWHSGQRFRKLLSCAYA